MEQRRLGRTGHASSVAILGGAAFWDATPEAVAHAFELAVGAGVNHLDIAPSYGRAQQLAGEVLPAYRDRLFVAGKSMERTRDGARRELEQSLETLRTDRLDLFQLHAVTTAADLAAALAPGGAAEALVEARDEGLVGAIGLTGHFEHVPALFLTALERVDLDTVMLPVNAPMLALPAYAADLRRVFAVAAERDLGVMAIKAFARGFWREDAERTATTWYEPVRDPEVVTEAAAFVLSLPVTAFAMPGDLSLLPHVLAAAERAPRLDGAAVAARIEAATARNALVSGGPPA